MEFEDLYLFIAVCFASSLRPALCVFRKRSLSLPGMRCFSFIRLVFLLASLIAKIAVHFFVGCFHLVMFSVLLYCPLLHLSSFVLFYSCLFLH